MKSKFIYIVLPVILSVFVVSAVYGKIGAYIDVLTGSFGEIASSSSIQDDEVSPAASSAADSSHGGVSSEPDAALPGSDQPSSAEFSAPHNSPSASPSPRPSATSAPTPKPATPTASPTKPAAANLMKLDNLIGTSESAIADAYGKPQDRELSEYGSMWNIYHNHFKRFIMIGIKDGIVTNVYSNSSDLEIFGIGQGTPRENVRTALKKDFGSPLLSIMKGSTRYPISDTDQKDVFTDGIAYYTFYYDITKGATLTSVQISGADIEQKTGLFPAASAEMASSMENVSFYLMNSIRVRMGKPALRWDDRIADISRAHSADMAAHDYFDHVNPEGLGSSARLKAAGLSYTKCAENIAKNHPNPICAFETFMNSAGHRNNILSASECTGIGVYMGDGVILLTQMFVTLCE